MSVPMGKSQCVLPWKSVSFCLIGHTAQSYLRDILADQEVYQHVPRSTIAAALPTVCGALLLV